MRNTAPETRRDDGRAEEVWVGQPLTGISSGCSAGESKRGTLQLKLGVTRRELRKRGSVECKCADSIEIGKIR